MGMAAKTLGADLGRRCNATEKQGPKDEIMERNMKCLIGGIQSGIEYNLN
jgi:hypothetical protein